MYDIDNCSSHRIKLDRMIPPFRNWLFANKRTGQIDIWTKPSIADSQRIHLHQFLNKCLLPAYYFIITAWNDLIFAKLLWTFNIYTFIYTRSKIIMITYLNLAENRFDWHQAGVFRNLSLVLVKMVKYFHTNKLWNSINFE